MKREDLKLYLRLLSYLKPYRSRLIWALLAMGGVAVITPFLAYMVKPVLDKVFFRKELGWLYFLPLLVVVLYFFKGACTFAHSYLMNYVGTKVINQIRNEVFRQIHSQSAAFFDRLPTGKLMSRLIFEVGLLSTSVNQVVTNLVKDTLTVIGLTCVIFYQDWRLALISLVAFPLAVAVIVRLGRRLRRISIQSQVAMSKVNIILQETIVGNRIVKAFGREDYEADRFYRQSQELLRAFLRQASTRALTSPVVEFLGSLGMAGIIFYGGYNVIQGHSTPGTFFSFLAALLMLYAPIKSLSNIHNTIQEGMAAGERVFAALDMVPEIQDRPGAVALPDLSREIVYQDVSFTYDSRPVLENINFTVRRGEVVALVGPSGAGKTTLVNLLPRFYEVTGGAVLIDGLDIRDVTMASLRDQIGLVTQQTFLFNASVRHNVTYGRPEASEEDTLAALKAAYAFDFVMATPEGLDTVIGEQGVRLSGGERQRLAIARAILKDPPILILDEATSSLDSEAEREVQQALDRLIAGRTTLVIAHRLSTVRNADRIVVVAEGRIIEEGTHAELLKQGGLYRRLYEMQFAGQEAEEPAPAASPLRDLAASS